MDETKNSRNEELSGQMTLAKGMTASVALVVVEHGIVNVLTDSSASGTTGSAADQRAYQGTSQDSKRTD